MKKIYSLSGKNWLAATFVMAIYMFVCMGSANAQHLVASDDASGIQKIAPTLSLTAVTGGVTINVNALAGILPEGTQLAVKLLSDVEEEIYIKSLKKNNGITMNQSLFYDITLYNRQGKEIQPKGEVTVSFSGLHFENNGSGLVVLHAEELDNGKEGFLFSKKYPETTVLKNKDLVQYASVNSTAIQFKTSHFSVYAVGTTQTATYNFMVGSTLEETQIVLNGESLLEPEAPIADAGQRFAGWYVQGETSPLVFSQAITVSTTTTLTVNAKFETVWYVFFNYGGEIVATKDVVAPATTTNASGVPLVITVLGKVFAHWSTTVDGPAFNFNAPITANTTLYAVLADRWVVSFNSQGGSPVMPEYVLNGTNATQPATPTREGYTFARWSETIGGTTPFDFSTPITGIKTLHAVWTPKTVNYSVVYWQQNAEDNDYTYYTTQTRTGLTGANATYATPIYTGFTLNTTLTNATSNNAVIKGDGTTVKNVYFDRNVWTLKIEWKSNPGSTWTTMSTTQVKYGQSTAPWYNAAVAAHFGYRWLIARGSSTSYSEAPDMPNNNLTVSGEYSGNTAFTIHYMEKNTTIKIHDDFIFYAAGNTSFNFTIEDAIALDGFTATPLTTWEPLESGTPAREGTIYYTRNNYTITFNTNNGLNPIVSGSIPYQASITNQALAGYNEGITTYTVDDITYTFGGWYETPNFLSTKYSFAGKTMPAKNLALYAKWTPPAYTALNHIVLENPGASGNTIVIPIPFGGIINSSQLVRNTPSGLNESDFVGWYWYVGDLFVPFDFGMAIYFDLELFPVWKERTYSVTYSLNGAGGTLPTDVNIYHLGAEALIAGLPGDIVPPAGKVFIGWLDNNGITHYSNNGLNITGDMTLTAQWGDVTQKTQLTYTANGGVGSDIVLPELYNNITIEVADNTYTFADYTFGGWNTLSNGTGAAFAPGDDIIVNNSSPVPNVLYAQWAKINLTKTGTFNDLNSNGKADVGETITYSFTVTNGGLIPLNNITITDAKITVIGSPITLAAGATSAGHFTGTYTLTQADIDAQKVDNTATVTGYTPILGLPVSDTDSETVEFGVCSLDVSCPDAWNASYSCSSEVPVAFAINSLASAAGYGITDACGTVRIYSVTEAITNQTCASKYTLTRTYIAYDDANNNSQYDSGEEISEACEQVITVNDEIAPVLAAAPEAVTVSCIGDVPAMISLAWTDNCDAGGEVEGIDGELVGGACGGTITRIWNISDACGNVAETRTQIITVKDEIAPVLAAAPEAVTVSCIEDVPAMINLSWTDNCGGSGEVVGNDSELVGGACGGTITRSWNVSDACGNAAETRTQIITINDEIAPVLAAAPLAVTVSCIDDVPAMINLSWTDNCGGSGEVVGNDSELVGGACGGTITRTWNVTDACGNAAETRTQIITVNDEIAPVIEAAPLAVTVSCIDAVPAMINLSWTDNCGGSGNVAGNDSELVGGACSGTITRTWNISDACGNVAETRTQIITVKDEIAPVLAAAPEAVTVSCIEDVPAMINLSWTDNCDEGGTIAGVDSELDGGTCGGTITRSWNVSDACGNAAETRTQIITINDEIAPVLAAAPLAVTVSCIDDVPAMINLSWTDNCGGSGEVVGNDSELVGGACGGTITRTWNVTDACGNAAETRTQIITVNDEIAPVIEAAPLAVTVSCIDAVPAMINLSWTDNCGGSGNVAGNDSELVGGACSGTITRTWNISDACGNVAETRTQIITVKDEIAPVLAAAPEAVTVSCIGDVPAMISLAWTDNCDAGGEVEGIDGELVGGACGGTITRIWNISDACGNVAETRTQIITVKDEIAPVLAAAPEAFTVSCIDDVPAMTSLAWTDNCDEGGTIAGVDSELDGGTCGGTITRTWNVSDACGNEAEARTQIITVNDEISPVITAAAANQTVECDGLGNTAALTAWLASNGDATATDNCGDITWANDFEGLSDLCGATGAATVIFTATDACGNATTTSAIFTIEDKTAPALTCPTNISVTADAGQAYATITIAVPAISDACGTVTLVNSFNGTDNASGQYPLGLTTVTYTATDDCNNVTECSFTVTVSDEEAPVINCPSTILVSCDTEVPAAYANYAAFVAAGGSATDNNGINESSFALVSQSSNGETCPETITRTYSIADNDGNASTCSQIITVNDETAPVLAAAPEAVTVSCIGDVPAMISLAWTDNCDADGDVAGNDGELVGGACGGTITRTWNISDACGNVAETRTQIITVKDEIAPVLAAAPEAVTVSCIGDVPAMISLAWTDNCDAGGEVEGIDGELVGGACGGTITRIWNISDACGNVAETRTQIITVKDEIAPVLAAAPEAFTVSCIDDVPAMTSLAWTDNCDEGGTIAGVDSELDGGTCGGTITRTWNVSDACGNEAEARTQIITVNDEISPVITAAAANQTVECDGLGNTAALTAWLASNGDATATDNCGDITWTNDFEGLSDLCGATGAATVIFTATDACGNATTTSAIFTIEDKTAPALTCPTNISVTADAGQAYATITIAVPAISDACGTVTLVNSFNGTDNASGQYPLGLTTVTYTATDDCNNVTECSFTVNVTDTEAPVINCPAIITVSCDTEIPAAYANYAAFVAAGGSATDNNGINESSFALESETSNNASCPETITRTYSIEDTDGNASTCEQTIIVNDEIGPVFTFVPENETVECNAIPAVGTPTASDNCDTDVTIAYIGESRTDGTCADSYTLTRTWTATDNCDNVTTATQTITVQDTQDPVFTFVPENETVECNAIPAVGTPTASDNCDTDVTIAYIGESRTDGTCADSYTLTRTWTATDNCGNNVDATQIITVQDTQAPILTVEAANQTVECDGSGNTAVLTAWLASNGGATATDNCGTITWTNNFTALSDLCGATGAATVTFTATDECGNSTPTTATFTIEDTTEPSLTCPTNISVTADAGQAYATVTIAVPAISDACGTVTLVNSFTGVANASGQYPLGLTTVTYTATDDCNNVTECSFTVNVNDTEAPVINCPATITVSCDTEIPAAYADYAAFAAAGGSATDNNGINESSFALVDEITDGASCPETITRTYSIEDTDGNASTCEQTIIVNDEIDPVFTFVPENVTVECNAIPAVGTPTASDNCDTDVTIAYIGESRTDGTCADSYTLTRTWTATDNCDNVTTATQTITVQDTQDPVFTFVPENVTVECSAVPAVGTPTASDNCDAEVAIAYNGETRTDGTCPDSYTLTRTWTATDNCGNNVDATQIITVQDTQAPILTVEAANQTVECDGSGNTAALTAWITSNGGATATDNCGTITWTNDFTALSDLCGATGAATVTFTATDECGNSTPTTATFTIEDKTAPALTCPANISVTADDGEAFATVTITIPDVSDACGTVTLVNDFTNVANASGQYPLGVTTVTYTATDDCGNETECSFTVTVSDEEAPVINCPATITVSCDTEIPAAYADYAAFAAAGGTATDNNGINEASFALVNEITDGATCPETITRTYSIEDTDGNASTCSQIIIVNDEIDPVFTFVPENVTVECNAIPAVGTPTASDNCDAEVAIAYNGETRTDGTCADSYTLTRTWTATDNCGNNVDATQIITVQDTQAPILTAAAANQTVECDGLGNTAALTAWLASNGGATATDNCGTITWTNNFTALSDLCGATGAATVLFTATDECGNSTPTTATFTIEDKTAPALTCPTNISVTADAGQAYATVTIAVPAISDACGTVTLVNSFNGTDNASGQYPLGLTTVTYTATDDCNNVTECSFTVNVTDTEAPVINCPATITVSCDTEVPAAYANYAAFVAAGGSATDNNGINESSFALESETSNNASCPETITRTYSIEDTDGNASTCEQTIIVNDEIGPVFTFVPENETVECNAIPAAGTPTASDNCDTDVTIAYIGESRTDGTCADSYTLTRTWTATDNCDNVTTAAQTITVQDTQDPVFTFVPENETVECNAIPAVGTLTASDNCDTDVTIAYIGESRTDGTCADSYTLTRTWTATDNCGNNVDATQIITVQDTQAPILTVEAANQTVECDGSGNTAALTAWLASNGGATATDNCGTITWTNNFTALSDLCGATGAATVIFTATDECGNSTPTTATFTIEDKTAPALTCPANISVTADDGEAFATVTITIPDVSDACGTVTLVNDFTNVANASGQYPLGVTTVTYTATDDCGNETECSFTVTVSDEEAPVINCPSTILVSCDTEVPAAYANYAAFVAAGGSATDNNGINESSFALVSQSSNGETCPETITRTYSIADNDGNASTCEQTIIVNDEIDPVFTFVPENETVECNAIPAVGTPTASDNCDTDVTIAYIGESRTDGTCADSYTLTRTWTATDNCDNVTTARQTITVQDTQDPVFTFVPENVTVECNAIPAVGTPTASDNCDAEVAIAYNGETRTDGTCADSYTLTRTWTATDNCGNSVDATQTITVQDTQAPVITLAAADLTVECDGSGNSDALNTWLASNGGATATDNCGTITWTNNFTALSDLCGATGTATVTWTATDDCGNSTHTTATFTIEDTTPPALTCPANISVTADAGQAYATVTIAVPAISDACGTVTLVNDFTNVANASGQYPLGVTTVTYTATDDCNNVTECSFTVNVTDTEAPVINCPATITVSCDTEIPAAYADYAAFVAAGGSATDNNGINESSFALVDEITDGASCPETITRTYSIEDLDGNASTCEQLIIVNDDIAPVITAEAADLSVECDGLGNTAALTAWIASNGGATATDNCSDVTWSNNFEGLSSLCGATGTATVTFTVTDACGNFTPTTATFTIIDVTAPVFTIIPEDLTVECDGAGNELALENWLANVAATDVCGEVTITNDFTGLSDLCGATGTATVTWTATDDCGNATTTTATFTIVDVTAPVFTIIPEDLTVECDGAGNELALENWLANVAATDVCGEVAITNNFSGLSDLCGATGTATVTWTATDDCGNTTTTTATFTIVDVTAPVFTIIPEDLTVECDGAGNELALENWLANVAATDVCGEVTITNDFTGLSDLCGATGTATVIWTATDDCGNTTTTTATFTIVDVTAPVFTIIPEDLTVECDGSGNELALENWLANVAATDVCGEVTITNDFTGLSDLCGATGTATVTWTATDDCGNTATTTATFTIVDVTAPVFTIIPEDLTVECDGSGNELALENWLANVAATDVCGEVTITNDFTGLSDLCGATGTATVTWTATDDCGNTATTTATFTIVDETAPVFTIIPEDLTVECDGAGNELALENWLANVAATDVCGEVTITNDFTGLSDLCGATGTATVIWTATDDCGNTTTTTATFTIVDVTAPVFTIIPEDLTVECDGSGNELALENWLANVAATDVCGEVEITNNFAGLSDLCGATGTATVIWTATDDCGNTTTTTATFTIVDVTAPVFTIIPEDLTVECDGAGNELALENWLANVAATDVCGEVEITNNFAGLSDLCGATGTATVTWTATDDCGNTVTTTATFTIVDVTAPVFTIIPEDLTVECDGAGNELALENWLANVAATDVCGEVTITNDFTGLSDLCGATGTATVIWTATDDCGNTTTTTATFTIVDVTAPVFTIIPEDLTVECDGAGNALALENWLANVAATDICGEVEITNNFAGLSDLCGATGTATVTWTATDDCGNTATTTATFTIVDVTAPVFTIIPVDMTIECDVAGNALALENWLANVAATDVCGEVAITNNFSGLSDGCGATGTATVIWTATDDCGNTATTTATFTIVDETAPVFTVLPEYTIVECDGNGNVEELEAWLNSPVAVDNCGDVTLTHDFEGLTALCGATGLATVTWTATDECGNSSTASATFAIFDYTDPTFDVIPEDLVVECDGNGNTDALNAWLESASASDICGDVTITHDFEGLTPACGATGSVTVIWTATDDCNNSTTASATFTIIDVTAPVFTLVPEDMTVECDAAGNELALENWLANVAATDVCGDVTITHNFNGLSNGCGNTGAATVTWTATDDCGNTATTSATFTIIDETAPFFTSIPENLTVECDGQGNEEALENWLNGVAAADNCGEVTITHNFTGLSNLCGATGAATVTWTATDDCGNTATTSATFTIEDTMPPSLVCPQNITVNTDAGQCGAYVQVPIPNTSDECSGVNLVNDYTGTALASGYYEVGTTVVVFTATDACGNASTCQMTVTVIDNEAPVITCPENITVNNDPGVCEANVSVPQPEVSDNCGVQSVVNSFNNTANASGVYPAGTTTVTWTVTDIHGLSSTCEMTITVIDTEAPVITCPADIAVNNDPGVCQANVTVPQPVVSDNCGVESVVNSFNGTGNASGTYPVGTTTITWTVTDINGMTASCDMTVTVTDTEAPVIVCPEDISVNNDPGVCEANVTVPQPEVSDNCGVESVVNSFNGTADASGVYPAGTTTVTWTVTDIHGMTASCDMTVTVTDTEAPVIVCPEDIVVNNDPGVCEANVTIPQPEVSDNCGIESMVNSFNGTADASGVYPVGTTVVTWTVTDINGLTAECEMTITVNDTELPVITCPEDMTVTAGADCNAVVDVPEPVVSDNCGIESVINSFNNTANASGVYPVGVHTITWTVTDIHGNVADCEMQLTVIAGPIANDDFATTDVNVPVSIPVLLNDTDCDDNIDPSTVTVITDPAHGFTMVDPQTGNVLYTPNTNYTGVDTFVYRVCDLSGLCDEALVTITIGDAQQIRLVAVDDSYTTLMNTPKDINNMENDIIPEGVAAAIEILTPTSNGSLVLHDDMTVTYTPAADFIGEDQYSYILYDVNGIAISDTAIAIITIVADDVRPELIIYNAITPNGDGKNDTWVIDGIEEYPDNEVLLFNRWSDQIREFTGYNNGSEVWDGTNQFGKKLPDATYYYIIRLRSINKIYTGWVIIHGGSN